MPKKQEGQPTQRELDLAHTAATIENEAPSSLAFLHSSLCQVHMPRSRTDVRVFERTDGAVSLRMEAGATRIGDQWVEQPLPYGTKPRLILLHLNSYATRHKTREIPVGKSLSEFMQSLGLAPSGGPRGNYRSMRSHLVALAVCRFQLHIQHSPNSMSNRMSEPVESFDAWVTGRDTVWPGYMRLSHTYYESLVEHSAPLDPRAIRALSSSSLELDIYSWLAHRLCRVRSQGQFVPWQSMRAQFATKDTDHQSFKRWFLTALNRVKRVYQHARIESIKGGLVLRQSKPPIPRRVQLSLID